MEKSFAEKVVSKEHIDDIKQEMISARTWLANLRERKVTSMDFLKHWLGRDFDEEIEEKGLRVACDELARDVKSIYYNAMAELFIIGKIKKGEIKLSDSMSSFLMFHEIVSNLAEKLK